MSGLWTRARLERMFRFWWPDGSGGFDVDTVAAAMEVTPRTIRRWLSVEHGRSLAKIPARQVELLEEMTRPDPTVVESDQVQARYAEKSIKLLGTGRNQPKRHPGWAAKGWLEPHVTMAVQIAGTRHRFWWIGVCRNDTDRLHQVERKGTICQRVATETYWHAVAVQSAVLIAMEKWRFQTPHSKAVPSGPTKCLYPDAPLPDFTLVAAQLKQTREGTSL